MRLPCPIDHKRGRRCTDLQRSVQPVQVWPRRGQRRGRRLEVDARGQRGAGHVVADDASDAVRPRRSSVHSWSGIFSAGIIEARYRVLKFTTAPPEIALCNYINVWDFQRATNVFRHRPRAADEVEWSQRSLAKSAVAADAAADDAANYERHNAFLVFVWSVISRDRKNSFSPMLN